MFVPLRTYTHIQICRECNCNRMLYFVDWLGKWCPLQCIFVQGSHSYAVFRNRRDSRSPRTPPPQYAPIDMSSYSISLLIKTSISVPPQPIGSQRPTVPRSTHTASSSPTIPFPHSFASASPSSCPRRPCLWHCDQALRPRDRDVWCRRGAIQRRGR